MSSRRHGIRSTGAATPVEVEVSFIGGLGPARRAGPGAPAHRQPLSRTFWLKAIQQCLTSD